MKWTIMWALLASPAAAATYTYTPVSVPNAAGTNPLGINDKGQVAGYWYDGGATAHGFVYDMNTQKYTVLDAPRSVGGTFVTGIDNNGIVYGYCQSRNAPGGFIQFTYSNGTYHYFRVVSAQVGQYSQGASLQHRHVAGFILSGASPSAFLHTRTHDMVFQYQGYGTAALDVNSAGVAVGYYQPAGQDAFTYDAGTLTSYQHPGAAVTAFSGVNDRGVIVGSQSATDDRYSVHHGFLFQNGAFTDLPDAPSGAAGTFPTRINNAGVIVGYARRSHTDPVNDVGFVLTVH